MKTLAIKLEDDQHAQLVLVARLSGHSLADELKAAVETHLETRLSADDLTAQAEQVLAEIDQEAASRRGAIEAFLKRPKAASTEKTPRRQKGSAG